MSPRLLIGRVDPLDGGSGMKLAVAAIFCVCLLFSNASAKDVRPSPALREALVQTLDEHFLKKGMDVYIAAQEDEKDYFFFNYILVNRPFVYKLLTETDLLQNLKKAGFRRANFNNGNGTYFCYNVQKLEQIDCLADSLH